MTSTEPTVFVIDDDKAVRSATKNLLESVGLRVETFASPREFLTSDRKNSPGCLVLDMRLPGASGLDFQKELASLNVHIPIIFITGHGDIPMTVQAMKAGASDFLAKPFRDQDLLDSIQKAVGRDRERREHELQSTEERKRFSSLTPREREVRRYARGGVRLGRGLRELWAVKQKDLSDPGYPVAGYERAGIATPIVGWQEFDSNYFHNRSRRGARSTPCSPPVPGGRSRAVDFGEN